MKYLTTFLHQLSCDCGYKLAAALFGLFNNKKLMNVLTWKWMNWLHILWVMIPFFRPEEDFKSFLWSSLICIGFYVSTRLPQNILKQLFVAKCEHTLSPACRHDMTWAVPSHSSSINFNLIESLSGKAGFVLCSCLWSWPDISLTLPRCTISQWRSTNTTLDGNNLAWTSERFNKLSSLWSGTCASNRSIMEG